MFTDILVPTDGSAGAEATIGHALTLADAFDATVHALYVLDGADEPVSLTGDQRAALHAPSEREGREATIRITDQAESRGLNAAREVREGTPHQAIRAYADEHDIDLLVMGTHGRTGVDRARLGSTTERVLALADRPVLAVRLADADERGVSSADTDTDTDANNGAPYRRIVVPTDGSDAAARAAETALDVVEPYDATVHVVYVLDTTIYDLEDAPRSIIGSLKEGGETATTDIATMVRDRDLKATTAIRRGDPAEEIRRYASSNEADLLAMGTRGRTIGTGRLLGSTTAAVVRQSAIPVLTVT